MREGATAQSVAQAVTVNIGSVFRWLADFSMIERNPLLAKPVPGRPPKPSAEKMAWIARTVKVRTPQQLKFEFGAGTLNII